jgi:hypothetical protein
MEKAVFAVFFKENFLIANWLDSLHSKCGLFIGTNNTSEGSIFLMFNVFEEYIYQKKPTQNNIVYFDDGFCFRQCDLEFVRIQASPSEIKHLADICNACCKNKERKYNFSDKGLSMFSSTFSPLADDNVDIYNAPRLHNAQALLLILRAGLDPESNSTLIAKLKEINSREVYSTQLYRAVVQVMTSAAVITTA